MKRYSIQTLATILFVLAIGIQQVLAVPAYPHPIIYTQSDGTQISIRIIGDEFNHYVVSSDGYTLVGGPNKDYYYATIAADGSLTSSSVAVKPIGRLTAAEKAKVAALPKNLRPAATKLPASMQMARASVTPPDEILNNSVNGNYPPAIAQTIKTTGKLKSLIILVEFEDTKFTVSSPRTAFTDLLNKDKYNHDGAVGSAWNYYYENSNGMFDPEFIVVGPYAASKKAEYYAGTSGFTNVPELIAEICNKADTDIDFSQYADEGLIRDIFIFFAGHNQAEGAPNTIWPHRNLDMRRDYNIMLDGQNLVGYACSSEYTGAAGRTMATIGTFSHEFGHVLGWPDLYDTDYWQSGGNAVGPGIYSLMASGCYNDGGRTPPAISILERWMMGWTKPTEFNESKQYELGPVTNNEGYVIPTNIVNEYFLAEYRGSGKTVWDNPEHINGSGMLVYHIDYSDAHKKQWSLYYNTVNTNPNYECMKVVRTIPLASPATNLSNTFFPGKNNVSTLLPSKNSDYNSWKKVAPAVLFDKISEENGGVILDITKIGGPSINMQFSIFQYDALISWTDTTTDKWHLSWRHANTAIDLGSVDVTEANYHMTNLQPATTYTITITATTLYGESWSQDHSFTTKARSGSVAHIGLSDYVYFASKPILLTLMDYKSKFTKLQWFVNNTEVESNNIKLPTGEHTIMAVVTAADGSKEYFIKYILVK